MEKTLIVVGKQCCINLKNEVSIHINGQRPQCKTKQTKKLTNITMNIKEVL